MHEMNSAQGSRSFALASLFLPSVTRPQIYELYRWCRKCDDLIDEAPSPAAARERLNELMKGSSLQATRPPTWINPSDAHEFLLGMAMDVDGFRYKTFSELETYCFRVAGVVGLMMCPLLGAKRTEAHGAAIALGKAMQLTNIARDVQTDARIGRIYIPDDLLPNMVPGILAQEPERSLDSIRTLLNQADLWYEEGLNGLRELPLRTAVGIAVAGVVYRQIGHKLLRRAQRNPAFAFRQRTVVSNFEKSIGILIAMVIVVRVKLLRWPLSSPRKKETASSLAHGQR
jgi:phytoene synthase